MLGTVIKMALLGLFSAPHCIAMCSVVCDGLTQGSVRKNLLFHGARIFSYVVCAAILSLVFTGLEQMSQTLSFVRYIILLIQAAILLWGVILIMNARLPRFMENSVNSLWRTIHHFFTAKKLYLLASAWGLFPCGVLVIAYSQATLSGSLLYASIGMLAFGIVSSLVLVSVPLARMLVKNLGGGEYYQALGLRVAGCFLVSTSSFSIFHLFSAEIIGFCTV